MLRQPDARPMTSSSGELVGGISGGLVIVLKSFSQTGAFWPDSQCANVLIVRPAQQSSAKPRELRQMQKFHLLSRAIFVVLRLRNADCAELLTHFTRTNFRGWVLTGTDQPAYTGCTAIPVTRDPL